jgi:hypothetical protein
MMQTSHVIAEMLPPELRSFLQLEARIGRHVATL